MASRAVWKGQLRLSLVSIPVELHSATKSGAKVSFRQIHGPSGKRVRYQKTVPGVGPVDTSEILKGYEVGDDEYLLLDPEEIDAIRLETKKTLELVQFVGSCEISPLYYDKPYYVVPTDDLAEDAYRVVRDALRKSEMLGLGQLTMRGREYLCAIRPCGDGLLLETLHLPDGASGRPTLGFSDRGREAERGASVGGRGTHPAEERSRSSPRRFHRTNYDAALAADADRAQAKIPGKTARSEGGRRLRGAIGGELSWT